MWKLSSLFHLCYVFFTAAEENLSKEASVIVDSLQFVHVRRPAQSQA